MTNETPDDTSQKPTLEEQKGAWPQHELLASYLRDGILSGDYPPNSTLPSTRVLKEKFGAAPQTIKNANDQLAEEGLVRSHKGKGIIVRGHRMRTVTPAAYKEPAAPGESYRWISAAEKQGHAATSTLLAVEEAEPPADVRSAMGLPAGGVAVMRVQILSLDGEPAELVKSYYPVELARGTAISEPRRIKGGTPRLLADMGYPPVRCVDTVSARIPTPEEVVALKTPTKLPVLRTLRVVYSADEQVIEVTVMAKGGHLYQLQYEF